MQATSEKNTLNCLECGKQTIWAGPLWIGQIQDKTITKTMLQNAPNEIKKFIRAVDAEAQNDIVGFYDLHKLSETTKKHIPQTEVAISALRNKSYAASATHFSAHAIKTNAPPSELLKLF